MKRALVIALLLLALVPAMQKWTEGKKESGEFLAAVKQEDAAEESFTLEVSAEEFRKSILRIYPDAVLEGSPSTWLGERVHGEGINVGGQKVSEQAMKQIFLLGSRNFELRRTEKGFLFEVNGVDKSYAEG